MIVDTIENAALYARLVPGMDKAFGFLAECMENAPENGRHVIDGDSVYANVMRYETRPADELGWEAHRAYLDIQFVVSGSEKLGYAPVDRMTDPTEYNSEKDCILSKTAEGASGIVMRRGTFAILWPQDAHQPKCIDETPSDVIKVVVKVKC